MAAEKGSSANTYEERRKQQVEENKKRFQDLGILKISKSLSQLTNSEKPSKKRLPKPKPENAEAFEPRRSSRVRNPVPSYSDDVDIDLPPLRKKSRSISSSWTSYVARPLEEIRLASVEERERASKAAEQFQTSLPSGNPSFVKSMVRSHVYSCFWLGLPTQFCKDHLSQRDLDITLQDEKGKEYDAKYLCKRTGLSGGWRGFALEHKLNDGDAVVFELVEPEKFKVYTFRPSISSLSNQKHNGDIVDGEGSAVTKSASEGGTNMELGLHSSETQKKKKANKNDNTKLSNIQHPEPVSEGRLEHVNSIEKNGLVSQDEDKKGKSANALVSQEDDKKGKSANARKLEEVQLIEDKDKHAKKPRKKPAPRLFRRKI